MNDKPALRPGLAVGATLRAVARDILADGRAALEDPAKSDADAVHDFRRAIKRWRAFLRLLDPFLGAEGRDLRDEAGNLARGLRGARDLQAALAALADLEQHGLGLSERSLATVRGRIETAKQAAQTMIDADMRRELVAALERAATRAGYWPLDALTFDDLAHRVSRGYGAVQQAIPADWPAATAEELHELRKRVVTHRHQMDIVEPLWPRFARMWTGEAQRLRDRLGKHQDLIVLGNLIGPHQPLAPWRSRLAPAIAHRKAAHVAGAARLAMRLFVDKPKAVRRRLIAMWEAAGRRA
jgi:CHAD domain-containing protein